MELDVRLLAHQGGWDEILFVLAPLFLLAGLLVLARRRADELADSDDEPATADADEPHQA